MVTKVDYGKREVEAARSVLVELIHLLGEFKDAIVLVGGSVPPLLFRETADDYVGTLDVNLALNHMTIDNDTYQTIRNALLKRGYKEGKQPFIFFREVPTEGGDPVVVEVNFLMSMEGQEHRAGLKRYRISEQEKLAVVTLQLDTFERVNYLLENLGIR
jgi:hypothetical protein